MIIQQLEIMTQHFDAQYKFYKYTMDFDTEYRDEDSIIVHIGLSTLILKRAQDDRPHWHHFTFNIPEQVFEESVHWLQERVRPLPHQGSVVVDFSASHWDSHAVYFEDGAGNVLEFITRHRLKYAHIKPPFNTRHIQNISEVGLATHNMPTLVSSLQEQFGLPIFSGNSDGDFCALGSDTGLLICSRVGRLWLPTPNRPADIYPTTIHLLMGDTPHHLDHGLNT